MGRNNFNFVQFKFNGIKFYLDRRENEANIFLPGREDALTKWKITTTTKKKLRRILEDAEAIFIICDSELSQFHCFQTVHG